jgi:hypothetical protein
VLDKPSTGVSRIDAQRHRQSDDCLHCDLPHSSDCHFGSCLLTGYLGGRSPATCALVPGCSRRYSQSFSLPSYGLAHGYGIDGCAAC